MIYVNNELMGKLIVKRRNAKDVCLGILKSLVVVAFNIFQAPLRKKYLLL